jgi:hypothetical protein
MDYTKIILVILVVFSITIMVSVLLGIGFIIFTPCERLSFSDKKEKSKILKFLKLR